MSPRSHRTPTVDPLQDSPDRVEPASSTCIAPEANHFRSFVASTSRRRHIPEADPCFDACGRCCGRSPCCFGLATNPEAEAPPANAIDMTRHRTSSANGGDQRGARASPSRTTSLVAWACLGGWAKVTCITES